ncbi:MAG: DUF362 domain-containing protein, partial [Elusimicrobiota bacterium]|nr:DUF362 domain-containing protein [Elusimicrobiota bacterium]
EHVKAKQFLALKMHFGEEGNHGYVKPEYVKQIVKIAREKTAFPFLTDASTLYSGKRGEAYHHLLTADKHGFNIESCGCPIMIADGLKGNSEEAVEVNLKHCSKVFIARDIHLADAFIFITHFKGHEMTGFGGTLKNIGMGSGSKAGKYAMHNTSQPIFELEKCIACGACVESCASKALSIVNNKVFVDDRKCSGCGQCMVVCKKEVPQMTPEIGSRSLQEKIVEYCAGVLKGKASSSVNFLNHISKFCDCFSGIKNDPIMGDIGIVAGIDPVAVDQASYDLVNEIYGSKVFDEMFPGIDPTIQLEYAQKLGLGTRDYELVKF